MQRIEASKLARSFGAVLERVVGGETIEVIRYGRVVAVLSPPKARRGPRPVEPDKLGTALPSPSARPTSLDAVSPQAQPTGSVGKVSQTRQQKIDELLRASRSKP